MTSEFNKLFPKLRPKEVIGTQRRPNRRDLIERNIPVGLPDLPPSIALQRAALKPKQAALINIQQIINDMNPVSPVRASLTVLVDPHDDPQLDLTSSSPELDEEEEKGIEDDFIAKIKGVEIERVKDARVAKRARVDMQEFAKKVRAVRGRKPKLTVATGVRRRRRSPSLASPSRAAAAADAADAAAAAEAAAAALPTVQPGMNLELTTAEAALALTNSQMGTNVTMEDLSPVMEVKDDGDTYIWSVGKVEKRELTVAEAALVLTNMQAGTNLTMQDLRTAREMVDLWDNEDVFQWTVGNIA